MIGKTILHYKIIAKLGEGGMGVVYKAEDTKLERIVAIKFLPSHIAANAEERARFKIEAKAAAALNHPNIATIHAIEEVDGEMFIVMEFIAGQELRKIVETSGPDVSTLPIEKIIDLATQVASGLQAAHAKGVTHRDIKSSNIMVTESGRVKIMDFGLAKLAGQQTRLTKSGMTVGTAAYMSPEQARGEPVDQRTDIWSFGVVLYEMLAGQLPFRGEYEAAMMYLIMNVTPEPITGVPIDLEQVVNKCLEKDVANRYQHIDEVLVDLRRISENLSTKKTASKPPATTRKLKPAILWPALILSAIVLAIAGYFFLGTKAESTERFPIAVVDFINETDEKELDSLTELLITALEQSRRLAVLPRASMFGILSRLGKDSLTTFDESLVREICERENINAMAMASIRKFGKLYTIDLKIMDLQKNKYLLTVSRNAEGQENIPALLAKLADETRKGLQEVAEDIQVNSANIIESTAANLEAYNHYFQGMQLFYQGKFLDARREYEQAIDIDSTFGLAYMQLAMLYGWRGPQDSQIDTTYAKKSIQKAWSFIDRIPQKQRYLVKAVDVQLQGRGRDGMLAAIPILKEMEKQYPSDKDMLFLIGDYTHHTDQHRIAVEYFDRVLEIDPRNDVALEHKAEANVRLYIYNDQFDEAEPFIRASFIDRKPDPRGFFTTGPMDLFLYRGQYRKALEFADRHIEWAMQNNLSEHDVHVYGWKAIILMRGWRDEETARQQLALSERFGQRTSWYDIYYHVLLGDYEGAEKIATEKETDVPSEFKILIQIQKGEGEKAIATAESVLDLPIKEGRFIYLYALAFCYLERGETEKAIAALRQLQVKRLYGYTPWERASYYPKSFYGLGRAYEEQGDILHALENYEKFLDLWKDADEDLPEQIDAKARYAKLKGMPEK